MQPPASLARQVLQDGTAGTAPALSASRLWCAQAFSSLSRKRASASRAVSWGKPGTRTSQRMTPAKSAPPSPGSTTLGKLHQSRVACAPCPELACPYESSVCTRIGLSSGARRTSICLRTHPRYSHASLLTSSEPRSVLKEHQFLFLQGDECLDCPPGASCGGKGDRPYVSPMILSGLPATHSRHVASELGS